MERELTEIMAPVTQDLRRVTARIRSVLHSQTPTVQEILDHICQYEGKLLRPALVLLSAGSFADAESDAPAAQEIVDVAAIVEMIHMASLIHDDVLDDAATRRRVSTVNASWGNQPAILLGDYIYARAFHLSTHLEDQACSRILSDVTRTICEGEIEELAACFDFDLPEERYFRIIGGKTAALYGAASELGALYAGATPEQAAGLRQYGYDLGLAFQIVDDCLDLAGKEVVVGKTLGTDILEGKITLPILELLKKLGSVERGRFEQIYRDHSGESPHARLRSAFDLRSAVEAAQKRADDYLRRALEKLEPLAESPYKRSLTIMTEYILCREW